MPQIPSSIRLPKQLFKQLGGSLEFIYRHIKPLLAIQSVVRRYIAGDIQVADLQQGVLYLITPSAALATHVKYHQGDLIYALQNNLPSIHHIQSLKVSVRPSIPKSKGLALAALPPNEANAKQILASAKNIQDIPLREALNRLAAQAKSI